MGTGVVSERRSTVRLAGQRELVLVRYPWARSGSAPDGCEMVEGYLRTRPADARPPLPRFNKQSKRYMADLTHVDATGKARMVDVSHKPTTTRLAKASGCVTMKAETLAAIRANSLAKGDVLGVARVAGIMAAKRTPELVPLCHQIPLSSVEITFVVDDALPGIRVEATVGTNAQTGVEMEAIMAVSVSLITIYDMAKGVDRGMVMGEISLTEKRGGKTGDWVRGQ